MDAPTIGVLRDVTLLVWLALLIGVAAYKWVRQTRPEAAWNWHGYVDAQPYLNIDAIVVGALSMLLLTKLHQVTPDVGEAAAKATPMELEPSSMFLSILFTLMMCAVLLFYLRAVRNLNPLELFGLRRLSGGQILGMALLFMIPTFILVTMTSAVITTWMQGFWPELNAQESVEAFKRSKDPLAKSLLVIAAVVVAPIVEETIFRGFIYGVIKRFTDSYFAAICSSLLFAIVHLHIGSLVPLTVLALIFCAAYELTGSLAVTMTMHALFNGTSLAMMILFPEMSHGNAG
ncbi:MAG: CPBP family intramembrane metalloprotease [Prosthecobacter sp.]|nr:CPBP family intramembrane metalloprotease [Prosthecobacter sp.]